MGAEITDPVKRLCKWCGKRYVVQKWSKSDGCRTCAPTIEDAIAESEPGAVPAGEPVRSSAAA